MLVKNFLVASTIVVSISTAAHAKAWHCELKAQDSNGSWDSLKVVEFTSDDVGLGSYGPDGTIIESARKLNFELSAIESISANCRAEAKQIGFGVISKTLTCSLQDLSQSGSIPSVRKSSLQYGNNLFLEILASQERFILECGSVEESNLIEDEEPKVF